MPKQVRLYQILRKVDDFCSRNDMKSLSLDERTGLSEEIAEAEWFKNRVAYGDWYEVTIEQILYMWLRLQDNWESGYPIANACEELSCYGVEQLRAFAHDCRPLECYNCGAPT